MFQILLLLLSSNAVFGSPKDVITLKDGTALKGVPTSADVTAFKGVPFASAPVGNLRFAPPRSWTNPDLNKVVDATQFGSPCKQHYFDGEEIGSEDCLFLNVWVDLSKAAPVNASEDGTLPVAVYIHGGSYMSGMGDDIEGTDFVDFWMGKAIVVSMNYRLNVFGFSGSDALRAQDSESGSTGNYGIQDQRMALQWVQENIGAFGGDKRQVMVYGESAGAGSVSNHLVMSKSFPYYSSAIMESGSFSEWITQPLSMAQTAYETLLVEVKCGDVDCLLKKPAEEIYQASLLIASTNVVYGTPYNPTVDGVELFTHPWISVAEGDVADVPILHGANLDEGSMFVPLPYDVQEAGLAAYWSAYLDEGIRILLNLYVTGDDVPDYPSVTVDGVRVSDYWWAADRSMADGSFYCSAKYASMELSRQQQQKENKRESSTYLYHFDYLADGSDVPFVQHTNEIPFMLHDNSYMDSKADFTMADTVAGYWGSFLSQHNPNSNNNPADATKPLPMWEAYMLREDNLLKMQGPGAVAEATGVNRKECDFFIPWTDAALKAMFPAPFHYP